MAWLWLPHHGHQEDIGQPNADLKSLDRRLRVDGDPVHGSFDDPRGAVGLAIRDPHDVVMRRRQRDRERVGELVDDLAGVGGVRLGRVEPVWPVNDDRVALDHDWRPRSTM